MSILFFDRKVVFRCSHIQYASSSHNGASRTVNVGPLELTVMKDKEGQIAWYDSTGEKLDRNLVGTIFGWATNTIPEMDTKEWFCENMKDGFDIQIGGQGYNYSEFLSSIKELASTPENSRNQAFYTIAKRAFEYANANNGTMTLAIDDLEQDENHNFIPTTYVFKSNGDHNHIYKLTYEGNNLAGWIKSVDETSIEDFVKFCERKFDQSYQHLININEQTIARLQNEKGKTKEEAIKIVTDMVNERDDYNFMGITKENINTMSEKTAMLLANLGDVQHDLSSHQFASIDDIDIADKD